MFRPFTTLILVSVTCACADSEPMAGPAPKSPTPEPVEAPIQIKTVAKGLEEPWSLTFLPDGRMLVTEKPGRLRIVRRNGSMSEPLPGVPKVFVSGQGGLLDVALSPAFTQDRLVYLSYSEPGKGGAGTAVARGRLAASGLEDVEVVWRQTPKVQGANHWGSRLKFARDGTLFITTGDRYDYRKLAQDLSTTIGKVVRINADGSIPQDNPFIKHEAAKPEIWSYGHRNMQGATVHPKTGQLWTVEHGAMGGDELNHPLPGHNYGWPVITYGVDYDGSRIGIGTTKEGMEQPVYYWDPVIAPSGLLFYTGESFPNWRGDLFIGSLQPGALVRLQMKHGRVVKEERYLGDLGERIRDVVQGPEGDLYVITDSLQGRVIKIEPAG